MASAPLKPQKSTGRRALIRRLRTAALTAGLLLAPAAAYATYPVIDMSGLQQAVQQLGALKEQISLITEEVENSTKILGVVNDISKAAQEQIDAIGKAGQITLPFADLAKLGSRLRSDAQCLIPDWQNLMPDLDLDDLDLKSICSARSGYAAALWFDPNAAAGQTWDEQLAERRTFSDRRSRLLRSAATDGLAHADVALASGTEESDKAAAELEDAAKAAEEQNTRLAVIAQGQALIVRHLATQNQILANLLRVQAVAAMQSGEDQEPLTEGDE